MIERTIFLRENKVHEVFEKGRQFDLQHNIYIDGVKREYHFYTGTRTDGMTKRELTVGKKVNHSK